MLYYGYALWFDHKKQTESYYIGILLGWCISPFWNSIPTAYVLYKHHKSFRKIYQARMNPDENENHGSVRSNRISYETKASLLVAESVLINPH